jgi:uncharacterized protein YndB with AHSA1/START domain
MPEFLASTTLSVTIEADPSAVYDLVSHPEHMPRWATTFVRGVRASGDHWVLDTQLMETRPAERAAGR